MEDLKRVKLSEVEEGKAYFLTRVGKENKRFSNVVVPVKVNGVTVLVKFRPLFENDRVYLNEFLSYKIPHIVED